MVRFLLLRLPGGDGLSGGVLSKARSVRGYYRLIFNQFRRLRCPPTWRCLFWLVWRPHRTQIDPGDNTPADGHGDYVDGGIAQLHIYRYRCPYSACATALFTGSRSWW